MHRTQSADTAIAAAYPVPPHIEAAARAIRYDLYHGPSWCVIRGGNVENFTADDFATFREDVESDAAESDTIAETYLSPVADALRDFIDNLPADLWFDTCAECVSDCEPEGWQDEETGEYIEPEWSDYVHLEGRDVVAAIFGRTIANEFS